MNKLYIKIAYFIRFNCIFCHFGWNHFTEKGNGDSNRTHFNCLKIIIIFCLIFYTFTNGDNVNYFYVDTTAVILVTRYLHVTLTCSQKLYCGQLGQSILKGLIRKLRMGLLFYPAWKLLLIVLCSESLAINTSLDRTAGQQEGFLNLYHCGQWHIQEQRNVKTCTWRKRKVDWLKLHIEPSIEFHYFICHHCAVTTNHIR